MKTQTPYQFFFNNAGYSYTPGKETKQQGRARCAKSLAQAEQQMRNSADVITFEWGIDETITSREFSDEKPYYHLWYCLMYRNGEVVQSLGGIDFGRDKEPWNDPYKRVVEAELALEEFNEVPSSI